MVHEDCPYKNGCSVQVQISTFKKINENISDSFIESDNAAAIKNAGGSVQLCL